MTPEVVDALQIVIGVTIILGAAVFIMSLWSQ